MSQFAKDLYLRFVLLFSIFCYLINLKSVSYLGGMLASLCDLPFRVLLLLFFFTLSALFQLL